MELEYYKELLNYNQRPEFLNKYLDSESLKRLKKVSYFCGMSYASRSIYNFSTYISRFDHSMTVALLVYMLTHDKLSTLQGLFHDISTPVFSHVIDYMNKDYIKQESTEKEARRIIKNDKYLLSCFKEDMINVNDIINFKKCTIVDNKRPKLCADRLDGVILTGIGWTKNVTKNDIFEIVKDIIIYQNEDNEDEIGFLSQDVAKRVVEISNSIDEKCHSNEDNYMMELLADITRRAIEIGYITYKDLFRLDENEIFLILSRIEDYQIRKLMQRFRTIKLNEVPEIRLEKVKSRKLSPIAGGRRIN